MRNETPVPSSHFLAFAKFGLVGVTTAAIYFFIMWLAETVFRLPYILAVSLAYFLSTLFHFLANKNFTFAANHVQQKKMTHIFGYLLVLFINYLITILIVALCVEKFHFSSYIGVFISVLFTMCVSYIGCYLVFKPKEEMS
jgi:putative flippase GtrA